MNCRYVWNILILLSFYKNEYQIRVSSNRDCILHLYQELLSLHLHTRTITRKDNHRGTRVIYRFSTSKPEIRTIFARKKSYQPFSSLQELGLSNDGNESAVHGQTVSPGQSPIHLQTTNLGQIDTVVLDEQRASGYPAVVAYQRSVFISLVHNMLMD